jgi:hypothetical protein
MFSREEINGRITRLSVQLTTSTDETERAVKSRIIFSLFDLIDRLYPDSAATPSASGHC